MTSEIKLHFFYFYTQTDDFRELFQIKRALKRLIRFRLIRCRDGAGGMNRTDGTFQLVRNQFDMINKNRFLLVFNPDSGSRFWFNFSLFVALKKKFNTKRILRSPKAADQVYTCVCVCT